MLKVLNITEIISEDDNAPPKWALLAPALKAVSKIFSLNFLKIFQFVLIHYFPPSILKSCPVI